ncbi:DUF4268 domain-containing protein [Sediminitomix flava]|uniref:Uncharacterized protein DUF4268 n=1 Tax=Sediminitomix flava TaxID=379075 RepID=A0A315ZAZ9_SEDFL|nr:DUF4268 domain-containing protein [Sediminitomix flava]PWJ42721.1 uncharacterized protein DUF4268 [Sediminitomix flava]
MFSKEEASRIRSEFWTKFGKMLRPYTSGEGKRINWTNYKTGVKNIFFKMDADKKKASIGIYLTHKDPDIQEIFFDQFEEMKTYLHNLLGEEWEWELHSTNEMGQTVSCIYTELHGVNLFRESDHADIYAFLKPRILKLNEFWEDAKDVFATLY